MNNMNLVDVLNEIVRINNDRIEGYKTAAEETDDVGLQNFFSQLLQTSKQNITMLDTAIEIHGGEATESTKITGKFFRVWMDVKAALSSNEHVAILDSCLYGEKTIMETYEKLLEENKEQLPDKYKQILNVQLLNLKDDYNKVSTKLASFQSLEKLA